MQELSYVLAVMVSYLRAMEDHNIPLETARSMVYARLAADADQFLTMAKFRALRLLWARIEESCGLAPKPLFIAADTAWRMLTQRDPYVNMLRATMATFAAGLAAPTPSACYRIRWRSACPMACAPPLRATPNWCCWKSPISPRSPIPPPVPAASRR